MAQLAQNDQNGPNSPKWPKWPKWPKMAQMAQNGLRNGTFLHPRLEGCATGKAKDRLKAEKVMVVQDPFELKRNIAGNVSPARLSRVVRTFEAAAKLLENLKVQGGDSKARNVLARLLSRDLVPQSEGTPADQESNTSYHRTKDEDIEEPEFV